MWTFNYLDIRKNKNNNYDKIKIIHSGNTMFMSTSSSFRTNGHKSLILTQWKSPWETKSHLAYKKFCTCYGTQRFSQL